MDVSPSPSCPLAFAPTLYKAPLGGNTDAAEKEFALFVVVAEKTEYADPIVPLRINSSSTTPAARIRRAGRGRLSRNRPRARRISVTDRGGSDARLTRPHRSVRPLPEPQPGGPARGGRSGMLSSRARRAHLPGPACSSARPGGRWNGDERPDRDRAARSQRAGRRTPPALRHPAGRHAHPGRLAAAPRERCR